MEKVVIFGIAGLVTRSFSMEEIDNIVQHTFNKANVIITIVDLAYCS